MIFYRTLVDRLSKLGPNDVELAEELSGQFEGDIVMSPEEVNQLLSKRGRTGLIDERFRWTDNIVPYQIREADFSTIFLPLFAMKFPLIFIFGVLFKASAQIHYIHLGAERLAEVTCLKFVPYQPDKHDNYIWVTVSISEIIKKRIQNF